MRAVIVFALLGMLVAPPAASAPAPSQKPHRIVSLNPCLDSVLVRIADPEQIAAISHYSHDPRATSIIPLAQALRFPVTSGTAEEVIAKQADLVIAGPHVALPTIHALQKLGIPLMQMGVPQSIADSQKEISRLAAAIGQSARGKRLNAAIGAALDRAEPRDKALVPALIWQGGGMVPGAGTLADELLRRTGFANMSSVYGLQQWDVLPIEHLLARPPRVLLSVGAEGQRDRMLSHPVMRHLAEHIAIRTYSPRLLHCGGPTIIDAVDRLSQIRRSLKDKTR